MKNLFLIDSKQQMKLEFENLATKIFEENQKIKCKSKSSFNIFKDQLDFLVKG